MDKELIVYGRTFPCPDLARSERFLQRHKVPYRMIHIDQDEQAGALVERYVGHRSVPTIVVARKGDLLPIEEPTPLPPGRSARSVDRGTMITEPSDEALQAFLQRHGLLSS
ncbi:glutaredoxin family protein [Kallotenue papyrolyticum]|uniref:glutaredoxin family protein n=1 Tax=Kallotenue papyrolyticum TaxID=1325125 RepID=UPI000478581B|nr:glutaredoxin family protein [Kallotenue papyrolyticum]